MTEAAQTAEPRCPRSWSLPAEETRRTLTPMVLRVNPALETDRESAVNCKVFALGGGMILEKAEKASICGQHDGILAERVSASVLPESPAPNRIDSNRGPWPRVAVTSRRPRPGCLDEGSAYGGDLHAVRSGQAGKLPGGFDEAGTGEVGHVRPR